MYSVSADQSQGAHVHEIPPWSSVEQQFQATLPKILRVAVVIGRSGRPDRAPIGVVRFEFRGCTTEPINSTVQAINNVETLVEFSSPVEVSTGKTCALHVTNFGQGVLGFYFNQDSDPQHRTVLHGATDPPGDPTPHDHALSGHVLGQLP